MQSLMIPILINIICILEIQKRIKASSGDRPALAFSTLIRDVRANQNPMLGNNRYDTNSDNLLAEPELNILRRITRNITATISRREGYFQGM